MFDQKSGLFLGALDSKGTQLLHKLQLQSTSVVHDATTHAKNPPLKRFCHKEREGTPGTLPQNPISTQPDKEPKASIQ